MIPTARVHSQLKIMRISFFLSDSHAYPYADDTSVFYENKNVTEIENFLSKAFGKLCE